MWTEPKTNWAATDYFNLSDYNRIKNNINELWEMAQIVFPEFSISPMGNDITDYNHVWDITEINRIENNLETIFQNVKYQISIGNKRTFSYNGLFIQYQELNRIESATLNIYNRLKNQISARKTLEFELGGVQF